MNATTSSLNAPFGNYFRMRIAFITSEYVTEPGFSGGLANYLARLCPELASQGNDVHVITRSTEDESFVQDGVNVHRAVPLWDRRGILDRLDPLAPRSLYGPYQDTKAAWAVRRKFLELQRRQNFDLVQLTNVMAIGLFFRRERKTPIVLRMSSFKPDCAEVNGVHSLAERVRLRLEKLSVCQQRNLYSPSQYVARRVREVYGCREPLVLETPFYLETGLEEAPRVREPADGVPYLLYFGRLSRLKGLVHLAEALPSIFERLPDARVVLVGGDSDTAPGGLSMKQYLFEKAGDRAGQVKILEPLRHTELYPLIQSARMVVLPSLCDNLPNAALESMAMGRPVVATTGTSFEQLIDQNESGLLVPRGDEGALADGIVKVWNMPDERRSEMGKKAKARIRLLSPEHTIPKLVRYYRSHSRSEFSVAKNSGKQIEGLEPS